jgi:hypothetical protein
MALARYRGIRTLLIITEVSVPIQFRMNSQSGTTAFCLIIPQFQTYLTITKITLILFTKNQGKSFSSKTPKLSLKTTDGKKHP